MNEIVYDLTGKFFLKQVTFGADLISIIPVGAP